MRYLLMLLVVGFVSAFALSDRSPVHVQAADPLDTSLYTTSDVSGSRVSGSALPVNTRNVGPDRTDGRPE